MMIDYKRSVEDELDRVMSENGLLSPKFQVDPKHLPSGYHSPEVLFKGFVELLVYNSIIDYLKGNDPEFADEGEANYYEEELFPNIHETKVNDQIDLEILHFKQALISLLESGYVDIEVLAAEPFNIKYAVAIGLYYLGYIEDRRTINKIKSGDVSLNIIMRLKHKYPEIDEVNLCDCLNILKHLASFTKY